MKWFLGFVIMYLPSVSLILLTILLQNNGIFNSSSKTGKNSLVLVLPMVGLGITFVLHVARQPGGFLDLWLNKILKIKLPKQEFEQENIQKIFKEISTPKSYSFSGEMLNLSRLAREKYECNDFDSALKYFNKAIKLSPDIPSLYIDRGLTKFRKNDIKGAFLDYNKAIELDPHDYETFFKRGCTRVLFKDHAGAIVDFTKAIEINPNFADAYFQKGLMFWVLKDTQTAFLHWEQASKLGNKDALEMIKKYK